MANNRHHILHHRAEWTLRPEAEALREHPSLIANIPVGLHNEIHRECPPIPSLGFHALVRTLKYYEPGDDTVLSMDNLMFAMERAATSPKAHRIEKGIAALAVEAVSLQRPFIASVSTRKILDLAAV